MPEPADASERQVLDDVRRYGWHAIGVEEDEEGPPFTYTIGLYRTFEHPEVIVLGPEPHVGHGILANLARAVEAGSRFEVGGEYEDILAAEYSVRFLTVDRAYYHDYLGYARWFYEGDDFPAVQCLLPDHGGRFPWEEGFEPGMSGRQPVLAAGWESMSPGERAAAAAPPGWPFPEPTNLAVITTRQVMRDGLPILRVVRHNAGDWQFVCGTTENPADGMVMCLGEILRHDPSVADIADLPAGSSAWRAAHGSPWQRQTPGETQDRAGEQAPGR